MKIEDVKLNIGKQVQINSLGDLAMSHKEFIGSIGTLIKLTRSGLVYK